MNRETLTCRTFSSSQVPTEVSVLLILCFRDTQTNKESAEAMLRVKSILEEGDGEKSMAQRRRHVRILEASMKDGYGLQVIIFILLFHISSL